MPPKVKAKRSAVSSRRSDMVFIGIVALVVVIIIGFAVYSAYIQRPEAPVQVDSEPMPVTGDSNSVRRTSVEDARAQTEAGTAVLVDVRAASTYAKQHAEGAISYPEGEEANLLNTLPKDKHLILYCT